MDMMVKKLSASEISGSIMYPLQFNPFPNSFFLKAVQRGKIAHSRNGFTNTKMFSRFYEGIEIVGIPDKVDEFVWEFKTYSSPIAKGRNQKVGLLQLEVYEFLTNLPGKLVMYDIHRDEITKIINVKFSRKKFETVIDFAVKLKESKLSFLDGYRGLQKSARKKIFARG